jgi:hypothetical protein
MSLANGRQPADQEIQKFSQPRAAMQTTVAPEPYIAVRRGFADVDPLNAGRLVTQGQERTNRPARSAHILA